MRRLATVPAQHHTLPIRRRRRSRALLFVLLPVLGASLAAPVVTSAAEPTSSTSGALRVVGRIPFPPSYSGRVPLEVRPTPMIVDPENNLGFTAGFVQKGTSMVRVVAMYDLVTLKLLDEAKGDNIPFDGNEFEAVQNWAVDPETTRLINFMNFGSKQGANGVPGTCNAGVDIDRYFDYELVEGHWKFILRPVGTKLVPTFSFRLPCPGRHPAFYTQAASIYKDPVTEKRKLYMVGSYALDTQVRFLGTVAFGAVDARNNTGSPFYVRQIDLDKQATDPATSLDWQIDLHKYGCGRVITFFIGRAGDSVYTYCHDTSGESKNSPLGEQGFLVRIPLDENDQPRILGDGDPLFSPPPAPTGVPADAWALPDERLNAVVRRIPTLPGFTRPFLDPETGRVLLLTDDFVNGEAVWVLDSADERFVGVMTPGDPPPRQRQVREGETKPSAGAAGFNPVIGRAYLYGQDGIIVASGRQEPPMAGTFFDVLGKRDFAISVNDEFSRPQLAVAPGLRRIFVPVDDQGYIVLEDSSPDPPPPPDDEPDRNTVQVDEREGVTDANTLTEAEASGLHVILAGGLSNIVNPNNPMCATPVVGDWEKSNNAFAQLNIFAEDNGERAMFDGACLAERVVAGSHRDFAVGYTTTAGGSSFGIEGEGQAVAFAPSDRSGTRDMQNIGECYRGQLGATGPDVADHWSQGNWDGHDLFDPIFATDDPNTRKIDESGPWEAVCQGAQDGAVRCRRPDGAKDKAYEDNCHWFQQVVTGDPKGAPDLSTGTRGRKGEGFPGPAARCSDATAPRSERKAAGAQTDEVHADAFHATAECDGATIANQSTSRATGATVPGGPVPITVRGVHSTVNTARTEDEGVVTTARAWADGVQIGPLTIGTIATEAITKAHGRTGTAHAELKRLWCDVRLGNEIVVGRGAGEDQEGDEDGCEDPETSDDIRLAIDTVNQGLQKVRLSIPEAEQSPSDGGYQGIVKKHPGVIAADRTINDDDSETVSGLQVVVYNDNAEGRSRVIVQFAGVRAESRYGIVLVPQFFTPDFPDGSNGPQGGPAESTPPSIISTGAIPFIAGRPPSFGVEYLSARLADYGPGVDGKTDNGTPFGQLIQNPLGALLEWLRQSPREFALLFMVFSILALPVYLILRRRAFEQALSE